MNKANYVYIDDYADESVIAIKDGLKDTDIIDVDLFQVSDFKDMITEFENNLKKYDGIILDLRLDRNPEIDVKFTATGLAQELRIRSASGEGIKEVPIILCSTDRKIREYYNRDNTSHDLFDYKFVKGTNLNWEEVAQKLQSIANGYETLKKEKGNLENILGRNLKSVDTRMLGPFVVNENDFPAYEYSQFILSELINKPGPLINEKLLAARLGIDIEESQDWSNLLDNYFNNQKYKGVFSDAWNRWWMDLVTNRFKEITGKRLAALNAEQRVTIISEKTKLNLLVAAKPIEKSVSSNFWTLCQYYQKPLDPLEGYRIKYSYEPKPWQDQLYLSFEAASERRGIIEGLKVHPDDLDKLESAKEVFRK